MNKLLLFFCFTLTMNAHAKTYCDYIIEYVESKRKLDERFETNKERYRLKGEEMPQWMYADMDEVNAKYEARMAKDGNRCLSKTSKEESEQPIQVEIENTGPYVLP